MIGMTVKRRDTGIVGTVVGEATHAVLVRWATEAGEVTSWVTKTDVVIFW